MKSSALLPSNLPRVIVIFFFLRHFFLLFGHISRYVKISTEGCRIRPLKHLAFAILSTFWTCLRFIFPELLKNL